MFHDSTIASKMQLQRNKIGYTINFGLSPYFHHELQDICRKIQFYVIGFDESLNKVAEKGQMDVFVQFWDSVVSQVCTRYYNSSFLGCAKATDLQNSLTEAIRGFDFGKTLQIAMDAPNVN